MSTPLTNKTTISSRNKMALTTGKPHEDTSNINNNNNPLHTSRKPISAMRPPSQITRNLPSRTPAMTPSAHVTRIASLANGLPRALKEIPSNGDPKQSLPTAPNTVASKRQTMVDRQAKIGQTASRLTSYNPSSRLLPMTVAKINLKQQQSDTTAVTNNTTSNQAISNTQSRLVAPQSRMSGVPLPLTSRSSSVVSSIASSTNVHKRQTISRPSDVLQASNKIPDTNTVRKGLAKFSNPIECQRQFQALSLKKRKLDEIIEARENEIDRLQEQLRQAIHIGVGYATAVQYFAIKLKLDSEVDLITESEQLKVKIGELKDNEKRYEEKLESLVDDYKNHLQVEKDLRYSIEKELDEARHSHSVFIDELKSEHQQEMIDLSNKHSDIEAQLRSKIELLETELDLKNKDLSTLRIDHETLNDNFNKLEESLTKDKDARMKYAQEKISQLQKDVESLNSVLEMRLERIHALEKDSLQLTEAQNEITSLKDANKALNQQLESLNAALDRRREQYENLIAETEKVRQELKKERKERRRMTMRTEQLEYVLNESCASESNMVLNSSF